ncbi:MAG: DHA2 family efflux MFS transporter permease subunit [Nitrospiraceae bacterium]|nr:DHA2 family efflux MFS transporter permease subunit [Nitrospiraceae bacterium]
MTGNDNKWLIALTVIMGTIMSALDTSIVNVALPFMRGNLGASIDEITWVATGYMLSNVIIMPIIGMLSSRFGRKRLYGFSIFLFTVSSMLCGMSWSLGSLVMFRIIQGVGGGALIPVSQAILRESFPPEEQGMAMGIYGFGVVLGPAFGPTLGGWLTDNYSWPWIFYINVPIGIINLLLVYRFLHDPAYLKREKRKIDFPGLGLLIVGLGALQLMLEKGERQDWFQSDFIVLLLGIAVIGLSLFIFWELTTDKPVVNLRLLKDANFASGTLLGGILGMGLYGSLFLLPLFLQQILGYPAFDSGLALMPRSLAMALAMPVAGRFYNKMGPRLLIGVGLVITAFSFWQLSAISLDVGFWDIFAPQFMQGLGFGMIFVALSTAALSTIRKTRMTDAAGLYNVVRQVFGSIGISLTATQLTRGEFIYSSVLSENVNVFNQKVNNWVGVMTGAFAQKGADRITAHDRALQLLNSNLMRQAAMLAYNRVFLFVTLLFIGAIPLVILLKSGAHSPSGEIMVD